MFKFIKSSTSSNDWYVHNNNVEICFWGRSNVGKSSLINALNNNSKLAIVSKTPGRTQLINYFEDEQNHVWVDLPGYGYANVSKSKIEKMNKMIEYYLKNNKKLKHVILLIDSRTGITKIDSEVIMFLDSINLDFSLVFTKIDKLNQKEKSKLTKSIQKDFVILQNKTVFFVSSAKKININNLYNYLENLFDLYNKGDKNENI